MVPVRESAVETVHWIDIVIEQLQCLCWAMKSRI